MASNDTKAIGKFPRRLLSSLRRSKKTSLSSLSYKNEFLPSKPSAGLCSHDLENAHNENLAIDLEATILLDSPKKSEDELPATTCQDNGRLLSSPMYSYRPLNQDVSLVESVSQDLFRNNILSPQVQRVGLGGPMSASTDSGIDCSPEQFVSFTRREAERMNQEQQILNFNESLLEPVKEVDSSSSFENGISENPIGRSPVEQSGTNYIGQSLCSSFLNEQSYLKGEAGGMLNINCSNEDNFNKSQHGQQSEPILHFPKAQKPDGVEANKTNSETEQGPVLYCPHPVRPQASDNGDYVILSPKSSVNLSLTQGNSDFISPSNEEQDRKSDYVTLTANSKVNSSPDFTATTGPESTSVLKTVFQKKNNEDASQSQVCESFVNKRQENSMMSSNANKTDEVKTEEAKLRLMNAGHTDHSNAQVSTDICEAVMNPIQVMSSTMAGQKAIPATLTPASVFMHENSAFAKCKSIKRSVSDAGRGFFGRFRHRSKDSVNSQDESMCDGSIIATDSKSSGSRKLLKLKHKLKGKSKVKSQQEADKLNKTVNESMSRGVAKKAHKRPPVMKEILSDISVGDVNQSVGSKRKSPVLKEYVTGTNSSQLEKPRKSPVLKEVLAPESIQDLTNSICQMTSALHASSAESIACMCDCKNRKLGSECCDKRKTPSPQFAQCFELDSEGLTTNNVTRNSQSENNGKIKHLPTYRACASQNDSDSCINNSSDKNDKQSVCQSMDELSQQAQIAERGNSLSSACTSEDCQSCQTSCDDVCCNLCADTDDDDDIYYDEYDDSQDSDTSYSQDGDLDCSKYCHASPLTGNVSCLSDHSSDCDTCSLQSFCSTNSSGSNESPCVEHSSMEPLDLEGSACSLRSALNIDNNDENCRSKADANSIVTVKSRFLKSAMKTPMNSPNVIKQGWSDVIVPPQNIEIENEKVDSGDLDQENESLFSSSFREVDFENGEVMYMENSFSDDFKDIWKKENEAQRCQIQNNGNKFVSHNKRLTSLDMNQDSSFTNVSFEGSFAETSFSVKSHCNKSLERNLMQKSLMSRQIDRPRSCIENSGALDLSSNRLQYESTTTKYARNSSSTLKTNVSFSGFNNNYILPATSHDENQLQNFQRSNSFMHSPNKSFSRQNPRYSSFSESSPLDLSKTGRWMEQHVGQVYSPAKRVLKKNRGVSESDLCKEILNLYVSDAEESGFEALDLTMNESMNAEDTQTSGKGSHKAGRQSPGDSSLEESILQYGTYVGPRHVQRETNVDDFSTSTVYTCYTGEARTRRLQGANNSILVTEDRRRRAHKSKRSVRSQSADRQSGRNSSRHNSSLNVSMNASLMSMNRSLNHSLSGSMLDNSVYSSSDFKSSRRKRTKERSLGACEQSHNRSMNSSLNESLRSLRGGDRSFNNSLNESHDSSYSVNISVDRSMFDENGAVIGRRRMRKQGKTTREAERKPLNSSFTPEARDEEDCPELVEASEVLTISGQCGSPKRRHALKDRTNTTNRLSSLKLPRNPGHELSMESLDGDIMACASNLKNLGDQSLDQLTMLHTARNGKRKVRCLTMDESQSVIKSYPPPKEASRVSWGQTISEMDLYRHTPPRRTPAKPIPILNQIENQYPYEEDVPSPIVLTKMRKPKSLAKRYKNWPWS